jgi:hypothetical protein
MKHGFTVYHSNVSWAAGVETRATELKDNVIKIHEKEGSEKVNIIAHSMGCLNATSIDCAATQSVLQFDSLGIETWEDGSKGNTIQQCNLSCSFGPLIKECWLDQNVFKECLQISVKKETTVFRRSFSTSKRNLIIQDIDIANGRIDFKIDYKGETSNCLLIFEPHCIGSFCKVKALDCKMIHKALDGSIQTIKDKMIEKSMYWRPRCGLYLRGIDN